MSRHALNITGHQQYGRYLRPKQCGCGRVRWLRDRRARGYEPACQVWSASVADGDRLALHHVSYEGVSWDDTTQQWMAREADEDLMPMCREHHQQLHRIMDGRKEFYGWDRRRASVVIIGRLITWHQAKTQPAGRPR